MRTPSYEGAGIDRAEALGHNLDESQQADFAAVAGILAVGERPFER